MNPFQVLKLGPDADARAVMQAATLALREKRYSAHEIAEARRQLMEPTARRLLAFLYVVDLEPLLRQESRATEPLPLDALKRLEMCA